MDFQMDLIHWLSHWVWYIARTYFDIHINITSFEFMPWINFANSCWCFFQPANCESYQSELITVWSSASLVYFIEVIIEISHSLYLQFERADVPNALRTRVSCPSKPWSYIQTARNVWIRWRYCSAQCSLYFKKLVVPVDSAYPPFSVVHA